jgi:hypothetical protein
MRNEDHPLIDCPHRDCARGGQDYEQRLQEQPSHMVRADVHRTASHTNWVEVTSRRFPIWRSSLIVAPRQLSLSQRDLPE